MINHEENPDNVESMCRKILVEYDDVVFQNSCLQQKVETLEVEARERTAEVERVSLELLRSKRKLDELLPNLDSLTGDQLHCLKTFAADISRSPALPASAPPPTNPQHEFESRLAYRDNYSKNGLKANQLCLMHWGQSIYSFVFADEDPHASNAHMLHLRTVVSIGGHVQGFATVAFDELGQNVLVANAECAIDFCARVFNLANLEALYKSDVQLFDKSKAMVVASFQEYCNLVKRQSVSALLDVCGVTKATLKLPERRISTSCLSEKWVQLLCDKAGDCKGGAAPFAHRAQTNSADLGQPHVNNTSDEAGAQALALLATSSSLGTHTSTNNKDGTDYDSTTLYDLNSDSDSDE